MALHPLHRLWRALPAGPRRAAFLRGASALAPRPHWPPPPVQGGIVVGGEIGRASGLGEGARLMHAALGTLGVPAWTIDCAVGAPGEASAPTQPERPAEGAALVVHVNAPMIAASFLRLPRGFLRGRRVVGYWAWELPVVPDAWAAGVPFVHEIWTPSSFSAAALERLAPGRVRVVPHPVAAVPPVPAALTRADFALPEDAVVVLVSFSLASSFARKNPLAAIAAFQAAFGNRADRVLVLKIVHAGHAPADFALLRKAAAGAANILFETRVLPTADSHALTRCADIVLSLHRSEGFGLVPAEAAVLGRAIVATDFSGTRDFLDSGCAMPVPYRLVPARDPRGVFEAPDAMWAEADVGAAATALQALAESPDMRAQLGQAAQAQAARLLGAGPLAAAVCGLGFPVGTRAA